MLADEYAVSDGTCTVFISGSVARKQFKEKLPRTINDRTVLFSKVLGTRPCTDDGMPARDPDSKPRVSDPC